MRVLSEEVIPWEATGREFRDKILDLPSRSAQLGKKDPECILQIFSEDWCWHRSVQTPGQVCSPVLATSRQEVVEVHAWQVWLALLHIYSLCPHAL